ncbi:MAG: hypothetical protein NC209_01545 [Alistipes sp.]|nr:hypothetical protein [Alistipes sp.]
MKKALFFLLLAVATGCHEAEGPGVPGPDSDLVTVRFALPGVGAEVSPVSRAGDPVHLDEGVTVRVLAFRRRTEGTPAAPAASADIEADTYAGEATYKVVKKSVEVPEGSEPEFDYVLVPCNVDADGAVDETNTDTPAELRLRAATYDFYALMPAVAVDDTDRTVSIAHGIDHASSCTPDITLSAADNPAEVELETLDRKCCRISFSVVRLAENVKTVDIKSVTLSEISESPLSAVLCKALTPGANTGSYTFRKNAFTAVDGSKYHFAGADVVLPKSKAKFKLAMSVEFNGSGKDSAPEAEMPELSFEAGKQYAFILKLKGDAFVLSLTVLDWNEVPEWNVPMGDWPHLVVEIGKWEVVDWGNDNGVGGYFNPEVIIGDWIPVTGWNVGIGKE